MHARFIGLILGAGLFLSGGVTSRALEPTDIFDQIAQDIARSQSRIVIINGAHNDDDANDYHRMFASCLLDRLASDGFTYFAAETFSENIAEQIKAGYPSQTNGFYVDDLAYGDLIRTALDHDMTFIPYEIRNNDKSQIAPLEALGYATGSINRRDWQQAKNLVDRVLNIDLAAKVFVYVGYAHITEYKKTTSDSAQVWLARFLKEVYDIDPFTIDQVHFSGSKQMKDMPMPTMTYWRVRNDTAELNVVTKSLHRKAAKTDAGVIHNLPKNYASKNAHDYLNMCNHRQKISMNVKHVVQPDVQRTPYLIEAFRETDDITEAIPLDRIRPSKSDKKIELYLPKGRVLIRQSFQDENRPTLIGEFGPIPTYSETEIMVVR